jgi:4,5-dihydroxyphthalate decarboxylase
VKKRGVSRRELIKSSATGLTALSLGALGSLKSQASTTGNRRLKIAGYAYDRVRAIQDGRLGLEGFDVSFKTADIYATSRDVFGTDHENEVSEIGLIPYITRFANNGFRDYMLIPVFISRIFRHRNIFVRTGSGIEKPGDLRGRRVGTAGYGMSACTWIRGLLEDVYGVRPADMHWIETTASSDGGDLQTDRFRQYLLPNGFPLEPGPPGTDESELIISGQADALITAITPRAFLEGHPAVKRLFPDFRSAERDYFAQTGVFPIMHAVAIRRDVAAANPGLPAALFTLYSKAKQMAYDDLEGTTSLNVTLPWVTQEFLETQALMGENFWPYGVEANHKELQLVMRYAHEQGLARRRLEVEEVFHPTTLNLTES